MDGKVLESMIWTWCVIGPSLEFLGFAVGVSFYVAGRLDMIILYITLILPILVVHSLH